MEYFKRIVKHTFAFLNKVYKYKNNVNKENTEQEDNTDNADYAEQEDNAENEEKWIYPVNFYCPICINADNDEELMMGTFWIKFECSHYIHYKCLYQYIVSPKYEGKCPLCLKKICVNNTDIESNLELFKYYCRYIKE